MTIVTITTTAFVAMLASAAAIIMAHGAVVPVEVQLRRGGYFAASMPFVFDAHASGAEISATLLQASEKFVDVMLEENARVMMMGEVEANSLNSPESKQAIIESIKCAEILLGLFATPLASVRSLLGYAEAKNAKVHTVQMKDLGGDLMMEILMVDPKIVIVLQLNKTPPSTAAAMAQGTVVLPVEVHLRSRNTFVGSVPFVFDANASGAEISAILQTPKFVDALLEEGEEPSRIRISADGLLTWMGGSQPLEKQAIIVDCVKRAKIRLGYVRGDHETPTPLTDVRSLLDYVTQRNRAKIHTVQVRDMDRVVEMLMINPKVIIMLENNA